MSIIHILSSFNASLVDVAVLIRHFFTRAIIYCCNILNTNASKHGKPFNSIPGPSSLTFIGVLHHFIPVIGTFTYRMSAMDFSEKLANNYGDIVRFASTMGKKPTVFVLTPELAAEVYKQQIIRRDLLDSMVYFRRETQHHDFGGSFGFLASDGAEWKAIRRVTDPLMLSERSISLHRKTVSDVTEKAINCIEMEWKTKDDSQFSEILCRVIRNWAYEALGTITYGCRLGALDDNSPQKKRSDKFLHCLNMMLESIFRMEFGSRIWKYFVTPSFKRAVKDYNRHLQFMEEFANESKNNASDSGDDVGCLLSKMRITAPSVALGVTTDIMLAGIDTVAQTVVSILYVLACNPEEQVMLRKSLEREGEDRSYLKACVKEALRVLPTTGGNYRTTTSEIIVGGYVIPKDVDIVLCHQYMSAQERQFPRAREFVPARWMAPPSTPPHPCAFLPFGTGGRACPGRTVAHLEMECLIERFVSRFRITWDAPPPQFSNPTVNFLVPPYGFVFERVN